VTASNTMPDSTETLAYLKHTGWQPVSRTRVAEYWTHPGHDELEVLVPLIRTASDYEKRFRLLTGDLARFEQRETQRVHEDISLVFDDVTQLRAHGTETDGSIPLQSGISVFNSATKLIIAAASATLRRQSYIRRTSARAREHASRVRLGHTRRGSYIVPIISKAARPPEYALDTETLPIDPEIEDSLFDRRVVVTLSRALGTLQVLAVTRDSMPRPSEVTDAVGEGVSYELCKGITDVLAPRELDEIDIDFKWALGAAKPLAPVEALSFPAAALEPLNQIASQLKTMPQERQDIIFGVVEDLHDSESEPDTVIGIRALVDSRVRIVWVTLDKASYRLALRCHENRQRVVVRGTLRTPHNRRATMSPTYFGPEDTLDTSEPANALP
jgi:hypothetical protein